MQSKNVVKLESFADYCRKHPKLYFWQALREWSKYDKILVQEIKDFDLGFTKVKDASVFIDTINFK